jgi:ATP-dependent Clp protease adapter protein ClpS
MKLLERLARRLSRVFPNHVGVVSRTFEEYPLSNAARVILTLAQADARAYAQIQATPERALLCALEDEGIAAHIASLPGANVETLREALLLALANPVVSAEARSLRPSERLTLALGHALERMRRRGAEAISRGDLLAGLRATEGETARLLGPLGVDPAALDDSPKKPLPERADPTDATVTIYVLDDSVSTMEDVMRILEHGFAMSVRTAFHRMLTTHHDGHARIGTFARAQADELLEKADRHTKARGSSVRFFVGRAG